MFVWMPANCDLSFCFRQAETLAGLVSEAGRTPCIPVTGHAHGLRGHMYLFLGGGRATHPSDFVFGGRESHPSPEPFWGWKARTIRLSEPHLEPISFKMPSIYPSTTSTPPVEEDSRHP